MKSILKTTFLIVVIICAFSTTKVEAILLSNGNEGKKDDLSNWMRKIREMETLEGSMGLNETINSNLTPEESNGIDVHMLKNSEYGAMVILAASSYGNQNKIEDGDTTTGNITGVVMKLNTEWVAAGSAQRATNFANAAYRYKNKYDASEESSDKPGSATIETKGWYGGYSRWGCYGYSYYGQVPNSYGAFAGMTRSFSNSIYSYDSFSRIGDSFGNYSKQDGSIYWDQNYARAGVVQGDGI